LTRLSRSSTEKNPWSETTSPSKPRKRFKVLQSLETMAEFPGTAEFRVADHLLITPPDERATAELVIGFISDNVWSHWRDTILLRLENDSKRMDKLLVKLSIYKIKQFFLHHLKLGRAYGASYRYLQNPSGKGNGCKSNLSPLRCIKANLGACSGS